MNSFKRFYTLCGISMTLLFSGGCSKNENTFSERPEFKQYFDKNKPSETLPDKTEQALLNKYRPRVFMAKGQTSFIDFYADYIANGSLFIDKKLVSNKVTQALLNQHKNNSKAEFRYKPVKQKGTPTVYARLHKDELIYKDQRMPLTFLSYNLVFANSGVIKGLDAWQRLAMGIVGSNTDWHQLDHYVGLTVALSNELPIAVMLQHHNYQTTRLLTDKTIQNTIQSNMPSVMQSTLQIPSDQRIAVDIAMQSNELYLHSAEQKQHPGLSWVDKDSIEFLKTGKNKPMMAGWDITHGEIEQEYTLKYLAAADAFYTFKGKLGESRKVPGRDGPPGANYVTLPALIPLANRIVSAYRPRNLVTEKNKIKALFDSSSFGIKAEGIAAYKRDFLKDLEIKLAAKP